MPLGYTVYTETCLGVVKSSSSVTHYQPRASVVLGTCPETTINKTPALLWHHNSWGPMEQAVSNVSERGAGGSVSNGFVGRRFTLHAASVLCAP